MGAGRALHCRRLKTVRDYAEYEHQNIRDLGAGRRHDVGDKARKRRGDSAGHFASEPCFHYDLRPNTTANPDIHGQAQSFRRDRRLRPHRALIDGSVQIDGVNPVFMTLSPEEIFFRALRHAEFDICELSLSSFTVKTAPATVPMSAVPAFVSRAFRHTSIYVRTDRIKKPEDLKGKSVGVPEYQLTANVWARAILEDDHGVKPADIQWVRGGIEDAGTAREDRASRCRRMCSSKTRRRARTISDAAGRGRDRRLHRAAPARRCRSTNPHVGWLFRRPGGGGQGLFQAHRHLSDHASGRRAAHAGRAASRGCRARCSRRSTQAKSAGARAAERHLGHQGDAAVRRGAAEGGARD